VAHRSRIRPLVEGAPILDLVEALLEPDSDGGIPVMTEDAFHCPYCQARRGQWLLHGPAARQIDDTLWNCSLCRVVGTRFWLVRAVLEDAAALARFWAFSEAAA